MSKVKKIFACTNCGNTAPKYEGRCSACQQWNTYVEEVILVESAKEENKKVWRKNGVGAEPPKPTNILDVKVGQLTRLPSQDNELDRVLGGGIVPGSLILIGGEPGIGKSTLLLQMVMRLNVNVLYVSGEESESQIKMRADRLPVVNPNCMLLTETNITQVLHHASQINPDILVIDSIQTLHSPNLDSTPGSVSQVRECAAELQRFAKESQIATFIIGHITKDGTIAGPKLLEHIVDTVLQFEGDQHYTYRILRTLKNRFGSASELGIYEMQGTGLREVSNPSELLLSNHDSPLSGSAISAMLEGARPLLIETQALVSPSVYGNPQRSATGFDLRRLNMLLAVLEKRCGFKFGVNDVFLNIAGGIRVDDPAIDLAVVAALISSLEDVILPNNICFAAEVGLTGEIRTVNRVEQRIQEAEKLGFKEICISSFHQKGLDVSKYQIKVKQFAKLEDFYRHLFT
jgi:DNA repair protein RadA/Sms